MLSRCVERAEAKPLTKACADLSKTAGAEGLRV